MKGKFRILGRIGLGVFLVCALMVAFLPVAPVAAAATEVTDVWVDFTMTEQPNQTSTASNPYIIHFKPATALERGVDYVTVTFPDGSTAMGPAAFSTISSVAAADVKFSTDYGSTQIDTATWYQITSAATCGGYRVKSLVPIDIAKETDVWVKIASSGVTAAGTEASTYKVYVATTKDTARVLSSAFALGDSTVTATVMEDNYPVSTTAGSAAAYIIKFKPANQVSSGGTVTVKFPVGTTLPSATIAATDVSFGTDSATYTPCGESPTVNINTRELTAVTQVNLGDGSTFRYIKIAVGANIKNPTRASTDDYYVMVRTSEDGQYDRSTAYTIDAAASASKVLVANGEIGLDAVLRYSDDATMVYMYSSQIYITLADQYGNAKYPGSEVTVDLTPGTGGQFFKTSSGTDGTGTMSSVDSVTISQASPVKNEQIVYYKSTTAGSCTLKVTDSGGTYTEAEWTFTVCGGVSVIDSSGTTIKTYAPTSTDDASETNVTSGVDNTLKYGVDYINDAIGGAMAGDTVQLGDGIYELDAQIYVEKKVTLTSVNGALKTTLRNTDTIEKAIWVRDITGTASNPIIIDGLTFERLRDGKEIQNAIWSRNVDYVTVRNCTFNYIMPNEDKDDKEGVIYIGNFSTGAKDLNSITISNNTFNHCCTDEWPNLGACETDWAANINVMCATGGYVKGVNITGNTLTDCDGYGIAIGGMAASATLTGSVTNNILTDCFIPICSSGFSPADGYSITGNTITGAYEMGIELEQTSNGIITIKNNSITGSALVNSESAIHMPGKSSLNPTSYCTYVQYNDIYDNASGTYSIKVDTATSVVVTDINCNYNWYGDASGPYYSALTGAVVDKSNPNGTGAKVSDGVFYYPWLHKPLATVVADNVSWQTSVMKLVAGWNTLSTPVPLIAEADTVQELIPSGMTIGYYYGATGWTQITDEEAYTLSPCDAVYVKMSEAKYVQLKFECKTFSTPSKDLAVGWNLISLAALDSDGMEGDDAVASVYKTAGNLPGYGQVVSPSLNTTRYDMYYNTGTSWVVSCAEHGDALTTKLMFVGLGYWIYMQNAATLAGFEITPIAPDLD